MALHQLWPRGADATSGGLPELRRTAMKLAVPKETSVYESVARYMRFAHPTTIFHFDLSGIWTPSHVQRNLYGRLNSRAWPDLFIAGYGSTQAETMLAQRTLNGPLEPVHINVVPKHGLFIEIKRDGTRLKKRDGTWASDHIAEQAAMLESLRKQGYMAEFAVGTDETIKLIDAYLGTTTTNKEEFQCQINE